MKNNTLKIILIFTLIISNKIIAQKDIGNNEQTENFIKKKGKYSIPLSKYRTINEQCTKVKTVCYVFELRPNCDYQRIKIVGTENSLVRAIADGKIVKILDDKLNDSKTIIIKHGDFLSVYSNVKNIKINNLDEIKKNQKIAQLSKIDNKYFLEFQIWHKTETVNPLEWINVKK